MCASVKEDIMIRTESSFSRVNQQFGVNSKPQPNLWISRLNSPIQDTVSFSKKEDLAPIISTRRDGNVLHVSFKGEFKNPVYVDTSAIQMKVRGVSAHQRGGLGATPRAKDSNVIKLAQSNWQEGQRVNYSIVTTQKGESIELSDPKFGPIGRVPDEISPQLIKLIKGKEKDFAFELSNVIAGNSKGAATIGLRVNLRYKGSDSNIKAKSLRTFNELLNSRDSKINDNVMVYQPKTSPTEVLKRFFAHEEQTNGIKAVKEIKTAIAQISKEINDPDNKNILIIGHCKPDGDTLGGVVGLETSIKGAYPEKNVDCAVDDKIPGLFRNKMPGIENVKRPYNPERIEVVKNNLKILESEEQTPNVQSQIGILQKELSDLTNPEKLFDENPLTGKERKKYDLVVLIDIPTPKRFSGAFKDYIENAKKVIYIDHHPHRINEWNDAKDETGVDMNKIHNQNLALIGDALPAATQLVTILAEQAGILGKTMQNNLEEAKKFVASIITGTSTDTGSFTRTANLLPEHMRLPVDQRPNFLPEGMSKWLIDELETSSKGQINKKWLRDNITFDIPDKKLSEMTEGEGLSPRDKMLTYALNGREIVPELGVGFISVNYDQMYDIWKDSLNQDDEFTLLDVQNGFKYSEIMGALKADPEKVNAPAPRNPEKPTLRERAQEVYFSPYQDDKIAVLIIQDKKKGSLTENSEISESNGLRLSFRSAGASNHAELLASLFGGGGHGGAAGGRVDLRDVELDSKLSVKIDGKTVSDSHAIYEVLKQNNEILHNSEITPEQKKAMTQKIEIVMAEEESGKTTSELITDLVKEIRSDKSEDEYFDTIPKKKHEEQKIKHKNKKAA